MFVKLIIPLLVFFSSPAPEKAANLPVAEEKVFPKIEKMLDQCFEMRYSNLDSARYYCRKGKKLSSEKGYEAGLIRATLLLGILHDVNSQYDSALFYYRESLALSHQAGDTLRVASNNANMGLTFFKIGNFREAMNYFLNSLGHFEKLGFNEGIASTYNNLGLIYIELGNYDRALDYYSKALQIRREMNDQYGIGAALTNIGNIYNRMDSLNLAVDYISESIEIKRAMDDQYGLAHSLNLIATVFTRKGELNKARSFLEDAIKKSQNLKSPGQEISAYLGYFELLMVEGRYKDAIRFSEKSLKMAEEIGSLSLQVSSFKSLSHAFEAYGNIEKAFEYHKKYISKKDELLNRERMNQVFQLELEYEREKSAAEIALLNRQAEINNLQIEKKELLISRRNSLIVAIITLFLVFLLLGYLYYIRQKNKEQLKMNQTLASIQQKVAQGAIEAEIKERQRIGEELHDSFGQVLSLIKLNLTKAQKKNEIPEQEREMMLEHSINLANKGFVELRNISHNMSPIMLKTKGLVLSVKDLLDRIKETNLYTIHFEVVDMEERLEPMMEFTLFRTIQELLNNIIKHANASEISVQMLQDSGGITIMMEDDGQGFDELELENVKGMGLKNAFSRIKNMNGELVIDSAKNRGTIINIIIPLKNDEKK